MSIKVNIELGQKVYFFRYDGDDDFVIKETKVARINISQHLPDFVTSADWCEENNFIELENGFVFDIIEQTYGNYIVDNDPFDGMIFFGYTKEEAEAKIKFINASEAEKQEQEEFETYKRLHEKFKDRI